MPGGGIRGRDVRHGNVTLWWNPRFPEQTLNAQRHTMQTNSRVRHGWGSRTCVHTPDPSRTGLLLSVMLRITSLVLPAVEIAGLVSPMDEGGSDGFTVNASELDSAASYAIRLYTDYADIGVDSSCGDRKEGAAVSPGNTPHSETLALRGCASPGGTVTATPFSGSTTAATATRLTGMLFSPCTFASR